LFCLKKGSKFSPIYKMTLNVATRSMFGAFTGTYYFTSIFFCLVMVIFIWLFFVKLSVFLLVISMGGCRENEELYVLILMPKKFYKNQM